MCVVLFSLGSVVSHCYKPQFLGSFPFLCFYLVVYYGPIQCFIRFTMNIKWTDQYEVTLDISYSESTGKQKKILSTSHEQANTIEVTSHQPSVSLIEEICFIFTWREISAWCPEWTIPASVLYYFLSISPSIPLGHSDLNKVLSRKEATKR